MARGERMRHPKEVYLIECSTDSGESWHVHTRYPPSFSHPEGIQKAQARKKQMPLYDFRVVRFVPDEIVFVATGVKS